MSTLPPPVTLLIIYDKNNWITEKNSIIDQLLWSKKHNFTFLDLVIATLKENMEEISSQENWEDKKKVTKIVWENRVLLRIWSRGRITWSRRLIKLTKRQSGFIGGMWRWAHTPFIGVQEHLQQNFEIGFLKCALQCILSNRGFKFFP